MLEVTDLAVEVAEDAESSTGAFPVADLPAELQALGEEAAGGAEFALDQSDRGEVAGRRWPGDTCSPMP